MSGMTMESGRWVLAIHRGVAPDKSLIGGKAWSIASMRALDLPVPPAFVITTRACAEFMRDGRLPADLEAELEWGMAGLEAETGRRFGGDRTPLLVAVRSGAPISMPGMMDTVLNLGIGERTETALGDEAGDAAFARDTHRRFLDLYARIVLKATLEELPATETPADWRARIARETGTAVPQDPRAQLLAAVQAVFESWNSRRARRYRQHHGIADDLGTAVTVQAMVFGNLGGDSGTGVLFSRNPLDGRPEPYGEYLARAQGEDVVSGRFTPQPLLVLRQAMPEVHAELMRAAAALETAHGDMQDIEFTVQAGRLYLLQTRTAKRAPAAAVRCAVDMVNEGRIAPAAALRRVTAGQVRLLLSPRLAPGETDGAALLAQGEAACAGVGVGVVVTNTDEVERRAAAGEAIVMARPSTSPDDVHGMIASRAVLTEQGGATSHAALVARDLGLPAIVGCGENSVTRLAGQTVTVDGATGRVFAGALRVLTPDEADDPCLAALTAWAEAAAPITVLQAADEAGPTVLDLDEVAGGEDPARLPELLTGRAVVRGGAIASDEGVRAALAAGVTTIIARHRLPVLLAALQAQRTE